jgi:hypothetical protein
MELWNRDRRTEMSFRPHLLIASALLVTVTGCGRGPQEPPAVEDLTVDQLRNAEYGSQWAHSGRAQLVDGQYRESAAPGSVTEILVRATEFAALGDLDGDGVGDGVIVLESDPGGSGVFYDLVAVLNRAGQPVPLAPVPLGDRVEVHGLTLEDGVVRVSHTKHGPNDPQCCPTLEVTLEYRLAGDRLVSVDQEPSRLSASPATRKMVHSRTPRAPMRS